MHAASITHCDLRPDNIIISPNGHAAVNNFSSAKSYPNMMPKSHRMTDVVGTNGYKAPELLCETVAVDGYTRSINIWGFGAIL